MKSLVVILLLVTTVEAQDKRLQWTGRAVHAAGAAVDIATSQNGREINPLLRNDSGGIATGRAIAIQTGLAVSFELAERKWPRRSKEIRISQIVIGSAMLAVGLFYNQRGSK